MKSGIATLHPLPIAEPSPYSEPAAIPRAQRYCSNCDASLNLPDGTMQCRIGPLEPMFLGMAQRTASVMLAPAPNQVQVQAEPIFRGVARPAAPDYWCVQWRQMLPDHPDLQPPIPQATHFVSGKAQ